MKILHLNYYENQGGAAIAAQRIHNSLLNKEVDSKILVSQKTSQNTKIIGPDSTFEEIINQVKISLQRKMNKYSSFKSNFTQSFNLIPSGILKKIKKINPDLVHLHWIGNEMISIKQLLSIKKPIVWTLHDMWPYCGSEHYTFSNDFINGYEKKKPFPFDFNFLVWKMKKKYINPKIHFVSTSNWQQKNIKKSYLYKNNFSELIPLPLDLNFWKPIDKKISKNLLGINEDNVILFGGDNFIDRKWKGFEFIKDIIKNSKSDKFRKDMLFIFFGEDKKFDSEVNALGIKYKYFKNVSPNSYDLKLLYSASDLLLVPSTLESFGQLALEASSCGTPSVCFENTGITEIVEHLKTGYVSKMNSVSDFENGIDWCLNKENSLNLSKNCIKLTNTKFSSNVIADKYIELYKSLIK